MKSGNKSEVEEKPESKTKTAQGHFTPQTRAILLNAFDKESYPTPEARSKIAITAKLTDMQVYWFFKKERSRRKKRGIAVGAPLPEPSRAQAPSSNRKNSKRRAAAVKEDEDEEEELDVSEEENSDDDDGDQSSGVGKKTSSSRLQAARRILIDDSSNDDDDEDDDEGEDDEDDDDNDEDDNDTDDDEDDEDDDSEYLEEEESDEEEDGESFSEGRNQASLSRRPHAAGRTSNGEEEDDEEKMEEDDDDNLEENPEGEDSEEDDETQSGGGRVEILLARCPQAAGRTLGGEEKEADDDLDDSEEDKNEDEDGTQEENDAHFAGFDGVLAVNEDSEGEDDGNVDGSLSPIRESAQIAPSPPQTTPPKKRGEAIVARSAGFDEEEVDAGYLGDSESDERYHTDGRKSSTRGRKQASSSRPQLSSRDARRIVKKKEGNYGLENIEGSDGSHPSTGEGNEVSPSRLQVGPPDRHISHGEEEDAHLALHEGRAIPAQQGFQIGENVGNNQEALEQVPRNNEIALNPNLGVVNIPNQRNPGAAENVQRGPVQALMQPSFLDNLCDVISEGQKSRFEKIPPNHSLPPYEVIRIKANRMVKKGALDLQREQEAARSGNRPRGKALQVAPTSLAGLRHQSSSGHPPQDLPPALHREKNRYPPQDLPPALHRAKNGYRSHDFPPALRRYQNGPPQDSSYPINHAPSQRAPRGSEKRKMSPTNPHTPMKLRREEAASVQPLETTEASLARKRQYIRDRLLPSPSDEVTFPVCFLEDGSKLRRLTAKLILGVGFQESINSILTEDREVPANAEELDFLRTILAYKASETSEYDGWIDEIRKSRSKTQELIGELLQRWDRHNDDDWAYSNTWVEEVKMCLIAFAGQ